MLPPFLFNKYVIMIILLGLLCGSGYVFYKDTQNTIQRLTRDNALLTDAAAENQRTINNLQADIQRSTQLQAELTERARQAEEYQDALIKKLHRHNLTKLALTKPGLIETRVNDATDKLLSDIESFTTTE